MDPVNVVVNAPASFDPILGINANYTWATPDGETALAVYDTAAAGWVYDLQSAGTTADSVEHDVFLSSAQTLAVNMGGDEVAYSMQARILAEISPPTQSHGDPAFAGAITGFTFDYNLAGQPGYDPTQPTFGVFLQIPLSSTQNNATLLSYFAETTNPAGRPTSVITDQLRSENALISQTGSSTTLESYNLSAYLADLASYLAIQQNLGAPVTNLARWTATGLYTGVMTQGAGTVVHLQVSDIQFQRLDAPSTAAVQINPTAPTIQLAVAAPKPDLSLSDNGFDTLQGTAPGAAPIALHAGAGAFNVAGVASGYFDPSGVAEEVARLFQAGLGRIPDDGAVAFYAASITSGATNMAGVAMDFLTSHEYLAAHAGEGAASFLTHIDQAVLGHAPDPSVIAATSLLNTTASRAAVLVATAASTEAVLHNQTWDGSALFGQNSGRSRPC